MHPSVADANKPDLGIRAPSRAVQPPSAYRRPVRRPPRPRQSRRSCPDCLLETTGRTNVPDHAGVLASRASDGSSARFVGGACGRATIAHAVDGHLTARRRRRQSFFAVDLAAGHSGQAEPSSGWLGLARRSASFFCRTGKAVAERRGRSPTVRPTDGSGERCVGCHGGACLRRAVFRTRPASRRIDRPRHHAACQRGAMFMAEGRGIPSDATRRAVLNTAPPGRAGRWRGVPRGPTFWLRTRLHAGEQRGGPGSADEPETGTIRHRVRDNRPQWCPIAASRMINSTT